MADDLALVADCFVSLGRRSIIPRAGLTSRLNPLNDAKCAYRIIQIFPARRDLTRHGRKWNYDLCNISIRYIDNRGSTNRTII